MLLCGLMPLACDLASATKGAGPLHDPKGCDGDISMVVVSRVYDLETEHSDYSGELHFHDAC